MTILRTQAVTQVIDRDDRALFVKELVVTNALSADGERIPLAMVRKRAAEADGSPAPTRAPVVLVHGYGQNRYAWHLPARSVSNHLAHAGFDVFNLDLRGHGRSRHLGARRPTHVGELAWEDLPAAVREASSLSGQRRVFLVGHSLGGLVSYAAAAQLGSAVAGIVTLGSPYQFTRGSRTLSALGRALLALDRRVHLGDGMVGLEPLSETMRLARAFIESPLYPLPIRGFAPGSLEPEVLSQHMSLAMDSGSVAVLRHMFRSAEQAREAGHKLGGLPGAGAFEALDLPLLVIGGTKDDLAPPSSVAPAFDLSRSTDKTYRSFPRGHLDLLVGSAAPHTVWPLVSGWLRARSAPLG
jgi:polyhydroxyalkanoate synthase